MRRGILKCVGQKTHNQKTRKMQQTVDITEVCQTGREGQAEEKAREGYTDFTSRRKTPRLCGSTRMAEVEAEMPKKYLKIHFILARIIQSCARCLLGTLLQKSTSPVQRAERGAHCKLTLCLKGNCYIPDVSFSASAAPAPSYPIQIGGFSLFLFFEKWCLSTPASQQTLMG